MHCQCPVPVPVPVPNMPVLGAVWQPTEVKVVSSDPNFTLTYSTTGSVAMKAKKTMKATKAATKAIKAMKAMKVVTIDANGNIHHRVVHRPKAKKG